MLAGLQHWLAYWTGVSDEGGHGYAFWSGIAGDFGYLGALGIVGRHLNCHERRCWRLGRHQVTVDGCTYKVCRRHHPRHGSGAIADDWHAAQGAT